MGLSTGLIVAMEAQPTMKCEWSIKACRGMTPVLTATTEMFVVLEVRVFHIFILWPNFAMEATRRKIEVATVLGLVSEGRMFRPFILPLSFAMEAAL